MCNKESERFTGIFIVSLYVSSPLPSDLVDDIRYITSKGGTTRSMTDHPVLTSTKGSVSYSRWKGNKQQGCRSACIEDHLNYIIAFA